MRVVLFRINWWNIKQATIGLFTMSKVCHTGLLLKKNKNLLDASESRGNVDWHKPIKDFGNQKIIVYEIPEDDELALTSKISPKEYALSKIGYKYKLEGDNGLDTTCKN
jgi:hypothetical protein